MIWVGFDLSMIDFNPRIKCDIYDMLCLLNCYSDGFRIPNLTRWRLWWLSNFDVNCLINTILDLLKESCLGHGL